jgi:hypothetical protein
MKNGMTMFLQLQLKDCHGIFYTLHMLYALDDRPQL